MRGLSREHSSTIVLLVKVESLGTGCSDVVNHCHLACWDLVDLTKTDYHGTVQEVPPVHPQFVQVVHLTSGVFTPGHCCSGITGSCYVNCLLYSGVLLLYLKSELVSVEE